MNLFFDLFKTFDGGGGDLFFIYKNTIVIMLGFGNLLTYKLKGKYL